MNSALQSVGLLPHPPIGGGKLRQCLASLPADHPFPLWVPQSSGEILGRMPRRGLQNPGEKFGGHSLADLPRTRVCRKTAVDFFSHFGGLS